jgi:DNA-binding CsgD family transcriptional regulator
MNIADSEFFDRTLLTAIDDAIAKAQTEPILLGIEGVRGIGKTSVLNEIVRRSPTSEISRNIVKVDPWDGDRPLAIVEHISGQRISTTSLTPLSPSNRSAGQSSHDQVRQAATPSSSLLLSPIATSRMVELGVDRILAAIHGGKHFIAVDDLDLAEQTDQEVLARLRSAAVGYPVLIVVTGRSISSGVALACDQLIRIDRLGVDESRLFAQRLIGAKPGQLLQRHIDSCEGIPATIVDLVQFAKADDLLVTGDDGVDLCTDDLPPTMVARMIRRLQQLGEMPTRLAQIASVIAGPIEIARCMSIADRTEQPMQSEVSLLVDAEIFSWKDGKLEWAQELIRESVLATLTRSMRQDIERRTAHWLIAASAPPEHVLAHLEESDVSDEELIPWLERVGSDSLSNQARSRALCELVKRSPQHALDKALLRRWATSAIEASDREMLLLALDHVIAADPSDGLGWTYKLTKLLSENRMAEASDCARRALAVVVEPAWQARILAGAVLAGMTALDPSVPDQMQQAVDLAEKTGDVDAICAVYTVRSRVAAHHLDARAAFEYGHRSLAAASSGEPIDFLQYQPHFFAAVAALECDALDVAQSIVLEGRALSDRLGSVAWSYPLLSAVGSRVHWELGEHDEAVIDATTAVLVAREGQVRPTLLPAVSVLAEHALLTDDVDGAQTWIQRGDEILAEGNFFGIEHLAVARSQVLCRAGSTDLAFMSLWQIWQLLDAAGVSVALFDLVPMLVRCALVGDRPDDLTALDAVIARGTQLAASATGAPRLVPIMQWAAGMRSGNVAEIERAIDAIPLQRVQLRADLRAIAIEVIPTQLPTNASANEPAQTEVMSANTTSSNTNVALDLVTRFTATERLVAEAIAKGCSNREIAEQCFMGIRTVETHVANVLRKLCVRTRVQAAVLLGS